MPTPLDELYEKVFGDAVTKDGIGLERFSAIAMYLLEKGTVIHDRRLEGDFSKTNYQVDAHHTANDGKSTMIEAKDYSEKGTKVGRGDVQKLAGALPDLKSVDAGALFSATGFTKPAQKYAESAQAMGLGKPITLYEISEYKEHEGFIRELIIRIFIEQPLPNQGVFQPVFSPESNRSLARRFCADGVARAIHVELREFLDREGNLKLSLFQLTSQGYGNVLDQDKNAQGCYVLPQHFVSVEGDRYEIVGLQFKVPHRHREFDVVIKDDREHRLTVCNSSGEPLMTLTDAKLREFRFDVEGRLEFHGLG